MTQRLSIFPTGVFWLGLAALALGAAGCSSILGAIFAPETLATSAAGNLASSAVTATDMNQVSAATQSVSDIDRILQMHPDAANSGELQSLRDSLMQPQDLSNGNVLEGAAPKEYYDHGFDRRTASDSAHSSVLSLPGGGGLMLIGTKKKPQGDVITLEQPPAYTDKPLGPRAERKPFHAPRLSSLDIWQPYLYRRNIQSIRLNDQTQFFNPKR